MGGEEATGRPAGGAGQHPKGRNIVEDAQRALRPGAAGLKGSVAHPIDGVSNDHTRSGRRSPGPISADRKDDNPRGGLPERRVSATPPC